MEISNQGTHSAEGPSSPSSSQPGRSDSKELMQHHLGPLTEERSEDESLDVPWNGSSSMDVDTFTSQEKNNGKLDDEDEARQKEKLADAGFFNKFDDDFDESDMVLGPL